MTIPNAPIKNTNPPRPDYAWLERTRRTFQELGTNPDSAALEGIIAEGQARLAKVSPDDPLLAGYLRLTIAEAQLDLGLEQEDETERLEGFAAGRKNCEQAAQEALGAGCGVACNLLPRAITLLAALYRAAPQGRDPGLADSLQSIAAQLDEALLEQEYLRQKALDKLESARLLAASMGGLALDERRDILAQTAALMLEAGELYLEAGDLEMVSQVQADLEAVEVAYNDPALPIPHLRLFEKRVDDGDLLPELEEDEDDWEEEDDDEVEEEDRATRQPPVRLAQQPARKRTSPLRWAISIGGLAISCLMMLCSGASLISGFANRSSSSAPPAVSMPVEISEPQVGVNPTQMNQGASADGVIFYDFSSAQAWPSGSGNNATYGVVDGKYVIEVDGEYGGSEIVIPAGFSPRAIKFDILIPTEYTTGTSSFYVYCYFRDENNYHAFSFLPYNNELYSNDVIDGEYLNGVSYPVTSLKAAGSTNQIEVQCDEYSISVIINGRGELASVHPEEQALGPMVISAGGFGFETKGFKALFDNMYVYETSP
jgi:hypothetical protein